MYKPQSFVVEDQLIIDQFIMSHSFGQLISNHQGQLFSTHLPFYYAADPSKLLCHVAKANPQHQDIEGQEVMVTVQGAHGYISPTWYASKNVPTWNYQAAHIYGVCEVFTDPDKLKFVVDSLTASHEKHLPNPWQADYPAAKLKGIVGIEIKITKIECKFKLNQNRSSADIQGVIDHLDPVTQADLLQAMKAVKKQQSGQL